MIKITENAQLQIVRRIFRLLKLYQEHIIPNYEFNYELREMLDLLWYSEATDLFSKRRIYNGFVKKYLTR